MSTLQFSRKDIKPITLAEEKALLLESQAGSQDARDRLVESHIPFLRSMCFRYKPIGADAENFFGDAVIGFLKAIDKADPSRSERLAAYARWSVRCEITGSDFYHQMIKVPETKRVQVWKLKQARALLHEERKAVTVANLMQVMDLSEAKVLEALHDERFCNNLLSLDSPIPDKTCLFYMDTVGYYDPEYERVNISTDAEYFLSTLSARERFIIERRFGIPVEMTESEIGDQLDITVYAVKWIFKEAMTKLQCLAEALQQTHIQVFETG